MPEVYTFELHHRKVISNSVIQSCFHTFSIRLEVRIRNFNTQFLILNIKMLTQPTYMMVPHNSCTLLGHDC